MSASGCRADDADADYARRCTCKLVISREAAAAAGALAMALQSAGFFTLPRRPAADIHRRSVTSSSATPAASLASRWSLDRQRHWRHRARWSALERRGWRGRGAAWRRYWSTRLSQAKFTD